MSEKRPKKRFTPKTKPTGFVPPGARAGPSPAEAAARPAVPPQTLVAWRAMVVYMQERGRWECFKQGRDVRYVPPNGYGGKAAVTTEDGVELEKAVGPVWQKLVDWCAERKIPPETYIRHCFAGLPLADRKCGPEPKELMGEKFRLKWVEGRQKRREEVRLALQIQIDNAARATAYERAAHDRPPELADLSVLSDGARLGLSPLFCYCLAVRLGTKDMRALARRLEARAILQFETNRVLYKELWAEWLPDGFAKLSRDVYPYLLAKLWAARKAAGARSDEE